MEDGLMQVLLEQIGLAQIGPGMAMGVVTFGVHGVIAALLGVRGWQDFRDWLARRLA